MQMAAWLALVLLCVALTAVTGQYDCPGGQWGSSCEPCGHCTDGVECYKITGRCEVGCELGYRMPQCTTRCEDGTYGKNCAQRCGKCSGGTVCDMITGSCPSGSCDQWYIGDHGQCGTFISLIHMHTIPRVMFVKGEWARLELDVKLDPAALSHYTFHAQYIDEHHQPSTTFTAYSDLEATYQMNSETLTLTLKGLTPNTQYWFRITIARHHNGKSEEGTPTQPVKVWTVVHDNASHSNANPRIVRVTVVLQVLCLLCFVSMAIWLLYQYYGGNRDDNKHKLTNDVSNNSFHASPSEGDTSRVAFGL